jgi:hypothetical protein
LGGFPADATDQQGRKQQLSLEMREMKVIGTWLLSLSLGLWAACPAWAKCGGGHVTPQVSYDEADVVALVELVGETHDNGTSGEFNVLHTWKAELPKRINIMKPLLVRDLNTVIGLCIYHFKHDGRYILYLHREKDGTFSTDSDSDLWHIHESTRKAFDDRLYELEKAAQCGCKGYEKGGFDRHYLYERADIIVDAIVERVRKRGMLTYADLRSVGFVKSGVPMNSLRMTIITEKEDSGCGYPVTVAHDVKNDTRGTWKDPNPNNYIFYLHYDENPTEKDQETLYFTDICSGNLSSSEITRGIHYIK